MGAELTWLWICTLQGRWGLISKLERSLQSNSTLPAPDPQAPIQNAAKQTRSARKFTLLRWQGETEAQCPPPFPWEAGSCVSREAQVASQITSCTFKGLHPPRGALLTSSNWGPPLPSWAPSQAVPLTHTSFLCSSWEGGIEFSFFCFIRNTTFLPVCFFSLSPGPRMVARVLWFCKRTDM